MKLKKALPKIELNGSLENRLPNNLNIYFPGQKNQELLIKLDLDGIASSPGAACSTRVSKISFVLEALGFPEKRAGGSLRFSLGRQTTKKDIDYAISAIVRAGSSKLVLQN
jgi:cysteine desulfurase